MMTSLFDPITIAGVHIANRFVMPGMQRGWCDDGSPRAELADYYRRRVEGGAGLIITESVAVDHESATQNPIFAHLTDKTLPAWRECVSLVKSAGGKIILQLWHEGAIRKEGGSGPWSAFPTLSPSGLAYRDHPNGRAASAEDLVSIRSAFVRSALLAKDAGADGVEVHGAHGYLLDQFLWAVTNRRTDGYGGDDIRDRVRFPAEIVRDIRAACGPDFLISFRFSQWKEADFAAKIVESPEELEAMIVLLDQAGVDLFHVSTRRFWEPEWPDSDLGLAGWARKFTAKPVVAVGSVGLSADVMTTFSGSEAEATAEASFAELDRRFQRGDFDMVAVGRSQIGDANWVRKVEARQFDAVRAFRRADLGLPDSTGEFSDIPYESAAKR